MKDDIEVLFEDDEDKKLNEERMLEKEENLDDYVKDESLENIFPVIVKCSIAYDLETRYLCCYG